MNPDSPFTGSTTKRLVVYVALFGFACVGYLQAEPYLAVRTGFKCGQCHVNRTGGGKRTDFGNSYSQRFLSARFARPKQTGHFSPQLTSNISVGANLRLRNTSKFTYRDTAGNTAAKSAFLNITEGNFYFQIDLIPGQLILYFDQAVSPEPGTRESFGLLHGLPLDGYVKAGKILLPYGYRLWDDNAFIREATGFTYSGPDLGVEIGLEPKDLSVSLAATMNQLSGVASLVSDATRIGVSWQKEINGLRDGFDTRMFGLFTGFHAGRLTLLAEADQIEWDEEIAIETDSTSTTAWVTTRQQALFAELDFLLFRGYNIKVAYDLFNRNLDIPLERDGQERITLGLEVFPIQFLQISVYYYINQFIPQNLPLNQNAFAMELHFFF